MALTTVGRELKNALASPAALPSLLVAINEYLANASSFSRDAPPVTVATSEALHHIFDNDFDHSNPAHLIVFLSALYALGKMIPTSVLISNWFETLLLPALKQPTLPAAALQHVQSLILRALTNPDSSSQDKANEFRNRILELYLNDAPSLLPGEDPDNDQADSLFTRIRIIWSAFSITNTNECLTHMHRIFRDDPSSRLPIVMILSSSLNTDGFSNQAAQLLRHPLFPELIGSLIYDDIPALYPYSLSVLVHLIPFLVLKAPELIPSLLPSLYLILYRALCAQESLVEDSRRHDAAAADIPAESQDVISLNSEPHLRKSVPRTTLVYHYTAFLLGLFPRTTLQFFHSAKDFLHQHLPIVGYTRDIALDESRLRHSGEEVLSAYTIPARILHFSDSQGQYFSEANDLSAWEDYSVSRLTHECLTLFHPEDSTKALSSPEGLASSIVPLQDASQDVSTQRMIDAAILARLPNSSESPGQDTLSPFQENFLLKSEVEFERWLRRELVKYTSELQTRYEELQRDSRSLKEQNMLKNCLRKYNVLSLEHQKYKKEATGTIDELKSRVKSQERKIAELQKTMRSVRDDSARLRMDIDEHKKTTAALQTQAGEDKHEIALLQTKLKEVQPKIERLQDYEVKIDQLTSMQELWDDDVRRFNAQADQLNLFMSDAMKLQKRIESLEKANMELQQEVAFGRRSKVEAALVEIEPKSAKFVESLLAKIANLEAANKRLRQPQDSGL